MDGKQLAALMKKRDDLITFLNANLEKQIQESQQGLLKKFLAGFGDLLQTDETGKVLNNAFNRNLLLSVDKVFADYGKQHNVLILSALMQGVNQLMDFNSISLLCNFLTASTPFKYSFEALNGSNFTIGISSKGVSGFISVLLCSTFGGSTFLGS